MKKLLFACFTFILLFMLWSCASVQEPQAQPEQKPAVKVNPASIDFGDYWKGTIIVKNEESKPDLGDLSEVIFYSEWTLGEKAGNVYPKKFTDVSTGQEVEMGFKWDSGGDIPSGVYNALVDIDGLPGRGTIKNLELKKSTYSEVIIHFVAAQIEIPLETDGDNIYVYPAGTKDKYEQLGRLDDIPDEIAINELSSYSENNGIWWLIPADVPLDIYRTYSNGDSEWITNFVAVPESKVKDFK